MEGIYIYIYMRGGCSGGSNPNVENQARVAPKPNRSLQNQVRRFSVAAPFDFSADVSGGPFGGWPCVSSEPEVKGGVGAGVLDR